MPSFTGETKDGAPIIGAGYWKKGLSIAGVVLNSFDTKVGKAYTLSLMDPITIPGEFLSPAAKGKVTSTEFSVGALKGFEMALRAAGVPDSLLLPKDLVKITCIGLTESGKGSPRVDFKIEYSQVGPHG